MAALVGRKKKGAPFSPISTTKVKPSARNLGDKDGDTLGNESIDMAIEDDMLSLFQC